MSARRKSDKKLTAAGFLHLSPQKRGVPVITTTGDEPFFKEQVFQQVRRDLTAADGTRPEVHLFRPERRRSVELADVLDELRTRSLFATTRSLLRVQEADAFLSEHKSELTAFLEEGVQAAHGVLMLEVAKLDGRLKLTRLLSSAGLVVGCDKLYDAPPPWQPGMPQWDSPLSHWVVEHARDHHQLQLAPQAAYTLHRQTGSELGLIDQALAQLALVLQDQPTPHRVDEALIEKVVGVNRQETIFQLEEAIEQRNTPQALEVLTHMLHNGMELRGGTETDPNTIAMVLLSTLRKGLARVRLARDHLQGGRGRGNLGEVLGIPSRQRFRIDRAARAARQYEQTDFGQLWDHLVEADLNLKRSRKPAGLILEELVVKLCRQEGPGPPSSRTPAALRPR